MLFRSYVAARYRAGGASAVPTAVVNRVVQLLDRVGTGAAQQSIIDASARVRAVNPELKALLDKEQALRGAVQMAFREISDLLAKDNSKTPSTEREKILIRIKELRTATDRAQQDLDETRKTISSRFPAYRDLVTPVSPKPDAVQAALGNGDRKSTRLNSSHT